MTSPKLEVFEAHYCSRTTSERLYTSALYSTRADAAAELFVACPEVQSCSTWKAHKQDDGGWFAVSDMELHRRTLNHA